MCVFDLQKPLFLNTCLSEALIYMYSVIMTLTFKLLYSNSSKYIEVAKSDIEILA